jgi:sugar phosphate permease
MTGTLVPTTGGRRRTTIALILFAQSTQMLAFGSIALFLPLIREDLGLDFTQAGMLAVSTTATYALMQIPAGFISDRLGPHRLFVVGLLGTNATYLLFSVLQSFGPLLVTQAVSGVFRALVFAPGLILMTTHFSAARRSTAMGLYVAGGFSSNIVLSLVGPLMVDALGWRRLFFISALVALLSVVGYWRFGTVVPLEPSAVRVRLADLGQVLKEPVVWMASVVQYVRLAMVTGITFWLPSYLVGERGYDLRTAGLIVALGALLTAPSNFIGGYLADRLDRPMLVIRISLAALVVCALALVRVPTLPMVVAVVAVQAMFLQAYFGPLFAIPIAILGPRTAGSVSGFANLFANLGALTFAYTLGAVRDTSGSFDAGFNALAAIAVVGLIATIPLGRMAGSSSATVRA